MGLFIYIFLTVIIISLMVFLFYSENKIEEQYYIIEKQRRLINDLMQYKDDNETLLYLKKIRYYPEDSRKYVTGNKSEYDDMLTALERMHPEIALKYLDINDK